MTRLIVHCHDPAQAQRYQLLMDLTGLNPVILTSTQQFWEVLKTESADMVLLATTFPDPPAFDICRQLKAPGSDYRELPIIVIFPEETPDEVRLQSLQLGAYDYLAENFNEIELLTKVTVLSRIKRAEDEFRQLAITDRLTGLYDRRYLFARANEELSRAKRYSRPISFMAITVDRFDAIDTQYGTGASDIVLQHIADTLNVVKRQIDVLARQDTARFALVLYNTDETGALVLANRILHKVRDLVCSFNTTYKPSVSIGLSACEPGPGQSIHAQELQQRAEVAAQRAQQAGGDRVIMFNKEMAGDLLG